MLVSFPCTLLQSTWTADLMCKYSIPRHNSFTLCSWLILCTSITSKNIVYIDTSIVCGPVCCPCRSLSGIVAVALFPRGLAIAPSTTGYCCRQSLPSRCYITATAVTLAGMCPSPLVVVIVVVDIVPPWHWPCASSRRRHWHPRHTGVRPPLLVVIDIAPAGTCPSPHHRCGTS